MTLNMLQDANTNKSFPSPIFHPCFFAFSFIFNCSCSWTQKDSPSLGNLQWESTD